MTFSLGTFAVGGGLALALTLSHALLRSSVGHEPLTLAWSVKVGVALAVYAAVFFAYTWLLRHYELSVLYPVYTGLSVAFVFFAGVLFFDETLTLAKGIGAFLVGLGLIILVSGG